MTIKASKTIKAFKTNEASKINIPREIGWYLDVSHFQEHW
jgi:hypothetical protein